jgi:hypothetical protein
MPTDDLELPCMQCDEPSAADARREIIKGYLAIRDGRDPPSDFMRRDPPLPLNCCRRKLHVVEHTP